VKEETMSAPYPHQTSPLPEGYHENVTTKIERSVPWTTPGLRITRLRLLTDRDFPAWDVSYCHGFVGNEPVNVTLPFHQLPKGNVNATILKYAKAQGIYAKGLGIFDSISCLW
jgi:hypothetical protein